MSVKTTSAAAGKGGMGPMGGGFKGKNMFGKTEDKNNSEKKNKKDHANDKKSLSTANMDKKVKPKNHLLKKYMMKSKSKADINENETTEN